MARSKKGNKVAEVVEDSEKIDVNSDTTNDDLCCDICLDGENFIGENGEPNDIVLCDNCNVAVHQGCYSVGKVPEGAWYCEPCEFIQVPNELKCQLCPLKGGAYWQLETHTQPTQPEQVPATPKWVHNFCATWVPEVYLVKAGADHKAQVEWLYTLGQVHKLRWNFRCNVCKLKGQENGACIQCGLKRCGKAFHPMCGLRAGLVGKSFTLLKIYLNNIFLKYLC